jgi:hypothetical protein
VLTVVLLAVASLVMLIMNLRDVASKGARFPLFLGCLVGSCFVTWMAFRSVNHALHATPAQLPNGIAWVIYVPGWFMVSGMGGGVHGDMSRTPEEMIIILGAGLFWAFIAYGVVGAAAVLRAAARPKV